MARRGRRLWPATGRRALRRAGAARSAAARGPPSAARDGGPAPGAPGRDAAGTRRAPARSRACIRAPSSPKRAISADRGRSATAPIRPSPNRASRAADIRVRGQQARRERAEKGRLAAGRDDTGRPGACRGSAAAAWPRNASRQFRPAAARAGAAPSASRSRTTRTVFGTPQPLEPVDLDLEQPERRDRPGRSCRRSPG